MSGWTCEPGQERYLAHLEASGALAEADRVLDAIERGDDLGPTVTVEELTRLWGGGDMTTPVEPDAPEPDDAPEDED